MKVVFTSGLCIPYKMRNVTSRKGISKIVFKNLFKVLSQ